jgi:hypothetical protein
MAVDRHLRNETKDLTSLNKLFSATLSRGKAFPVCSILNTIVIVHACRERATAIQTASDLRMKCEY